MRRDMEDIKEHDRQCSNQLFSLYGLSRVRQLLNSVPTKPPERVERETGPPRFAIVGAGISGIAAAAHIKNLGFDCHIFEAGGEDQLGGIWARVNKTSGLQIHSSSYRFHPSIKWQSAYPLRDDILSQTCSLWKKHHLSKHTSFSFEVSRVYREENHWIVNERCYGEFHGVVVAVGTCGGPHTPKFPGMNDFSGNILRVSELDDKDLRGKEVVIVGGGASAVEAVENATAQSAASVKVLARVCQELYDASATGFANFNQSEQWIIPRSWTFGSLLAFRHSSKEMILGWLLEHFLRTFYYRDLVYLAPPQSTKHRLSISTPILNSHILEKVVSAFETYKHHCEC